MTTFTIDPDNNITAFAHPQEAEMAASGQSFASQEALDTLTESWPMDRFVTVWNSFAGIAGFGVDLKPVKKFENRDKAVARIWKALQRLDGRATEEDTAGPETAAEGAPTKTKASKNASCAKKAPKIRSKASKPANTESGAPREGRQDRPGSGDAAAEEWRDYFGDHGQDGLAGAHRSRVHGGSNERGRLRSRIVQARGLNWNTFGEMLGIGVTLNR
jgi:hypothetical protein